MAAGLAAMEMVPTDEFRTVAEPARHAERLAADLGRTDLEMRARLVQADVLRREGDAVSSGRIAHEVNAWAVERGDAYLQARSHMLLALFFRHVGDLADALGHAVQAVARTGDEVPARIRARHLSVLAMVLHENGSSGEARQRAEEALAVATAAGDDEMMLQVLNNLAYSAYDDGDRERAQNFISEIRAISARCGLTLGAHVLDTIARVEMAEGRYAGAEETLRPILDGSARHLVSEAVSLAGCLLTVAEAQRLRGAFDVAQATLDRAAAVCEERGIASYAAQVREERAELYAAIGLFREAYEEYLLFHAESQALQSAEREARARALQAVFETEEARRESTRFRELAERDALTGLYNRRYVDEHLGALLERAPLSVALVDLDHFKRVNDTLSHAAGDLVLQEVAGLLAEAAADTAAGGAVAARLGGEEFLLIFPETDAVEAARRCERVRRAIGEHSWGPVTGELPVTASIGVSTAIDGRITPSALLAQADRNLYAAKRAGRNRVVADPA
nr:GGDEF domain-containing protein [Planosporangium thailandense]